MEQSSELTPKNRIGLQMYPRHTREGPLGTLPAPATLRGVCGRYVSLSLTASGAD